MDICWELTPNVPVLEPVARVSAAQVDQSTVRHWSPLAVANQTNSGLIGDQHGWSGHIQVTFYTVINLIVIIDSISIRESFLCSGIPGTQPYIMHITHTVSILRKHWWMWNCIIFVLKTAYSNKKCCETHVHSSLKLPFTAAHTLAWPSWGTPQWAP